MVDKINFQFTSFHYLPTVVFFSQAMKHAEQEPFPPIYVDSKKENEVCINRVGNVDILMVKTSSVNLVEIILRNIR